MGWEKDAAIFEVEFLGAISRLFSWLFSSQRSVFRVGKKKPQSTNDRKYYYAETEKEKKTKTTTRTTLERTVEVDRAEGRAGVPREAGGAGKRRQGAPSRPSAPWATAERCAAPREAQPRPLTCPQDIYRRRVSFWVILKLEGKLGKLQHNNRDAEMPLFFVIL